VEKNSVEKFFVEKFFVEKFFVEKTRKKLLFQKFLLLLRLNNNKLKK